MSFSRSKASTTTSSTTTNQSLNQNIQDNEAPVIIGEGNTIVQSDMNAIGDATKLAESAIAGGFASIRDAQDTVLRLSSNTTDFARDVLTDASAAGARNLDALRDISTDSLYAVQSVQSEALSANKGLVSQVIDAITNLGKQSQASLSSTVTSLNTIAREQSKSTDERVAGLAENTTKYIVIGVGVVAVVGLIAFGLKK